MTIDKDFVPMPLYYRLGSRVVHPYLQFKGTIHKLVHEILRKYNDRVSKHFKNDIFIINILLLKLERVIRLVTISI